MARRVLSSLTALRGAIIFRRKAMSTKVLKNAKMLAATRTLRSGDIPITKPIDVASK